MAKRSDVPEFGPLSGIKMVHSSISFAGPFCAQMYAEMGADVIWIESTLAYDTARVTGWPCEQDRRNQRTISLNIPAPEGKEVFFKLIKEADVFLEASRGGQYDKWGLTDEVLWEQNPALVIIHVSGFGQYGVPEYVSRASFDPVAQAFGCLMHTNGYPDRPPIPAFPVVADYFTALFALGSSLAALHKARETGQGESIDVAQYEALMRIQTRAMEYVSGGLVYPRDGNRSNKVAGYGNYQCKDGEEVCMIWLGTGVLKGGLPVLGLEYGSELFPEKTNQIILKSPAGELLNKKIQEFCDTHTALEAEEMLASHGVPCSRVMTYATAVNHPHYLAREVFLEWKKVNGESIKGVNIFPKLKNNPGQVWRGAPSVGMDNDDILTDLGLREAEITQLYDRKVIRKS